jgi:deoxyuridine 5'-triphosphate nucleotidohydrolase
MVSTDLSLAIPPQCYGRVAPRSGLAWKHSIDTGAGVIDSDYRGPLKVILFNFSDVDFQARTSDCTPQGLDALNRCAVDLESDQVLPGRLMHPHCMR